jgi:hypothetical protein
VNDRIVLESKQEESHEKRDCTWRRWISFCIASGIQTDPYLTRLSKPEQELIIQAILALYQVAQWHQSGNLPGQHSCPLLSLSVRDAAGHLAASFWSHFKQSPLHLKGSSKLLPSIRALLKAYNNADPLPFAKKQ